MSEEGEVYCSDSEPSDFIELESDEYIESPEDDGPPELLDYEKINSIEEKSVVKQVPKRVGNKIGRNEKCPCNSGKKYKKCCLK